MWTSCSGPDMWIWFRIWYVDLVCAPRFSYPWEAFLPFWCYVSRRRFRSCCDNGRTAVAKEGREGRRRRRNCLCSCSLAAPSSHSAAKIVVVVVVVSLFPCIHLHRIANHQIFCKLFFWSLFEFCTSLLVFRRFGVDSFNLLQCLSIQIFWFWFFVSFFLFLFLV